MRKPGVIALPILLGLGAITGYLAYDLMVVKATPVEGIFDNSPYRRDLPDASAVQNPAATADEGSATGSQPVDQSRAVDESSEVITVSILKGSVVQGAPAYGPDPAEVPLDATIRWVNEDSILHTATSIPSADNPTPDGVFDTGFLNPGNDYSIAASEIGSGEYTYYCIVHPYMVGTLTVE